MIQLRSSEPSRKLRVAYLFQNPDIRFSESDAVQIHIIQTIRGLKKRGHRATLLALQSRGRVLCTEDLDEVIRGEPDSLQFGDTGWSGLHIFRFLEGGVRRIQTSIRFPYLAFIDDFRMYESSRKNLGKFDVIHERYNGMTIGGALASRKLGIPYFIEINADVIEQSAYQGTPLTGLQKTIMVKKTRICFDIAAKVICVSEQLKEHLDKNWNVDPNKTVALPCAADVEKYVHKYDVDRVREEFSLGRGQVVVWVGGFYPWHNLEYLITCFRGVVNKIPNARLLLVGDGRTRTRIEQRIVEQNLEESVFMAGMVDHDRVPEMLSVADVAVSPFVSFFPGHGGAPLKLFEYMAAGKAIVATRINQVASIIQDGYNGRLIDPDDEAGFIEAIVQLLTDREERNRLGRNAQMQAIEQHSWKSYTKRLENIYLEVLHDVG